ncbi:hypothetical protein D932_00863 [Enterococcus casseliflavus 14-MB-W-14]|nr:hypothetical protein D932_00863 [Enterococcus casseliflavus 14-MB-W-14]
MTSPLVFLLNLSCIRNRFLFYYTKHWLTKTWKNQSKSCENTSFSAATNSDQL